ncbi:MAG TPA: SDR family oxidoreductase [Anaerolineales bacterium]|nr:SDR family oxidoreductase [Anaerolineales bacterium]
MTPSSRSLALVTGASSGLGAAFAKRLARDGHNLILVARRKDRLEQLAVRLRADHAIQVEVLPADLTEERDVHRVESRISQGPALALLVNNAGFGGYGSFIDLDPEVAEDLILLQVLAVTRLTRAALPGMIAAGGGAVINVSSRLGYSAALPTPPLPKRATYAGAKAFLNTFTQLLAAELAGSGVSVQALCPGVIRTEFHQVMGIDPASYPAAIVMSAEDVVQASLAALPRGEVVCLPALEDPALLTKIDDAQRELFDQTRSGTLAARYRA